jgi:hypothetical protein
MEGWGWCPECKRNDQLANEQRNIAFDVAEEEERAKARLQQDAHIKDVLRKLLDLAVESLEDADLAEKKVRVIMQSAIFADNESDFFPEIQANIFLADCYYTLRLGANPSIEQVSKLSVNARNFLTKWADSHRNAMYASQAREVYTNFRLKKEEQERKDAEESAKQQSIWEKENAKREAESKKNRLAAEARENAKKRGQKIVAVFGSTFCSMLFLCGFIVGGLIKIPFWIKETNYTATGSFFVLLLICIFKAFFISREYILDNYSANRKLESILDIFRKDYDFDTIKLWLLWTGMILLFIVTCFVWKELTGPFRVALIALTIGLPMIPFVRGVFGSFALGIVGGLIALPISYISGAIISSAYLFIMK